jgi:ArsR family transcriptional regulator, arsenate/arsenite/antimonite-responsive transcriptional repressor
MRDAARFFKVLADEARLKMLWLLANHDELCVCDIMAALGITQSKASRHLLTMRHAGLVVDRKEGLWSYYKLCPVDDPLARRHLEILRETLARHPDAAPALRGLRKWLDEKGRKDACPSSTACAGEGKRASKTAPKKKPRRGRAS